MAVCFSN